MSTSAKLYDCLSSSWPDSAKWNTIAPKIRYTRLNSIKMNVHLHCRIAIASGCNSSMAGDRCSLTIISYLNSLHSSGKERQTNSTVMHNEIIQKCVIRWRILNKESVWMLWQYYIIIQCIVVCQNHGITFYN